MNKFQIVMLLNLFLFSCCFSNSEVYKILYYNSLIPADIELRNRVLTTVCCDDCCDLSRVADAGKVITQNDATDYQLMHNGIKILKDCYYGAWMTVIIELLKGHHEPQEEKAFNEILEYIPDNAVMLELGSYWGYYSMWFQQKISGAKNFLIEPDPKNIIIGQKNFKLNAMQGYFIQAMIGAYSSDLEAFIDWDHNKHEIKQICIDDFANENNIPFIDILHSDIQGAEIDMLKGCQRLIAQRRIGYFVISTHRGVHQDCLKILEEANFDIILSITREESFSADGLIIAKLPEINGPSYIDISRRTPQFCSLIDGVIK